MSPPAKQQGAIVSLLPGLILVIAVAAAARGLHRLLPFDASRLLGEVILAVLLGLIVANLIKLPAASAAGIRFAFQKILRFAIIILGARFAFDEILAIGGKALLMILVLMLLALGVAHGLGHLFGVPRRLASLIGIGTAVCGNSAISATAPVIGARDEDVSFAIATNTLFGTLAVFVYPLLGHALGFGDAVFGTWAGTAVNDTSQVVATGFAYSDAAGQVATTVKLTRNALMGFVIVGMGFAYSRGNGNAGQGPGGFARRLRQSVPGFVLGFLLMALLNTLGAVDWAGGVLGRDLAADLKALAKLLILIALAGVGLGTRLDAMRRIGWTPFVIGLATALTTSLASLALIHLLGAAGE